MATPEFEAVSGFATFEVTIPADTDQHTLALYGLGDALGWRISARQTLPSDLQRRATPEALQVTPDDLRAISWDVWSTSTYGDTAANFLDETRRDFTRTGRDVVMAAYSTATLEAHLHEQFAFDPVPNRHPVAADSSISPFSTSNVESIVRHA